MSRKVTPRGVRTNELAANGPLSRPAHRRTPARGRGASAVVQGAGWG